MGVTEKYIQNSCLDFFRPFRALHQTLQLFSHTFALLLYGWGLATQPSKNGVCPKQLAYAYLISSAMIQNRAGQGRAGQVQINLIPPYIKKTKQRKEIKSLLEITSAKHIKFDPIIILPQSHTICIYCIARTTHSRD